MLAGGPLPGRDLGLDHGEPVRAWLDGLDGRVQRVAQDGLEAVLLRIGTAAVHDSRSSTERSAIIARELWLFTAPRVMPMAAAIWASDKSA